MKKKRWGCFRWGLIGLAAVVILIVGAAGYFAYDNSRLPTHSQVIENLSQFDKARLEEAYHLRQALGDQVLPGWGQANIPQINFNEQYAFLVSYSALELPPPGWQRVPGGEQRGGSWEWVKGEDFLGQPYARVKLAAPDQNSEAFVVIVGDQNAASLGTMEWMRIEAMHGLGDQMPSFLQPIFPNRLFTNLLVDSSDMYISALLHEQAHVYQYRVAPDRLAEAELSNIKWSKKYPVEDESLRQDWQTELDLLVKALRSSNDGQARDLARQFLAQRQQRRQAAKLSADLIDFERQREWVEGIARYAEISIYRAAANTPGYQAVDSIQSDPEFHDYQRFNGPMGRWTREVDQIAREAGAEGDNRYYYTGMAQAVLLDRFAPGWKERLFDKGVWLEDLLAEALKH